MDTGSGDKCSVGKKRKTDHDGDAKTIDMAPGSDKGKEVEMDLVVPGFHQSFKVAVPELSSVRAVKQIMVDHVNKHIMATSSAQVGTSWLVYLGANKGDLLLEDETIDSTFQLACLEQQFGIHAVKVTQTAEEPHMPLCWPERSSFELVIFSLQSVSSHMEEPFTFRLKQTSGLQTNFRGVLPNSRLRAWDFCTGESFASTYHHLFSFSKTPRNKRDFRDVSFCSVEEPPSFQDPDGAVLGCGNNAIVHRVDLTSTVSRERAVNRPSHSFLARSNTQLELTKGMWDAAVKRSFSFQKMVAAMGGTSEAGMVKRLRMAGGLNKFGRLLYFYGFGVALASNSDDREEYKFEMVMLSRYSQEFSSYTFKKFLDQYTTVLSSVDPMRAPLDEIQKLQEHYSLIKVKEVLLSLMNGFRDLTIMGIQAYDFNHLENVLISRDGRRAHLLDIDGQGRGAITFPSEYVNGKTGQKPALDVDLSTLLPEIVCQLLLGKGRGKPFVNQKVSSIKTAKSDIDAKNIIETVVRDNFFQDSVLQDMIQNKMRLQDSSCLTPAILQEAKNGCDAHIHRVSEWLFAVVLKKTPWASWTDDIYEAVRCVDHLPAL